jgi:hypothetical protein
MIWINLDNETPTADPERMSLRARADASLCAASFRGFSALVKADANAHCGLVSCLVNRWQLR